jgi:hypothetical protein
MGNTVQTDTGVFKGLNIAALEKDLAMVLPNIHSRGEDLEQNKGSSDNDEGESKKDNTKGFDLGNIMSTKIAIPETDEEIQAALEKGSGVKEKGSDEVKGLKQEKGGEDAIIKEDSPLYLHAATLHEEGILPTLDLESLKDKPFTEAMQIFLAAQKKYFDDGRNEYLNSLSDRQKEFLEMIELGIPQEQAEQQFTIEDAYSKITDQVLADDEDLQKQVLVQSMKLKGLTDKQIQVFIKAAEDDEKLFEGAKEARDEINAYIANQKEIQVNAAKQAQVEADKREQDLQKEIKTTIEKIDEILPGIKISAADKTKLNEYMTKPVEEKIINGKKVAVNLINKTRMEDKVLFDLKLNYFIELGLFNSKADLSKFVKKATSSAAEKLSKKLSEEPSGVAGKGVSFDKSDDTQKKTNIIFPQFM